MNVKPYLVMLVLIATLTMLRTALHPVMQFTGTVALYFLAIAIAAVYRGARLTLFTTMVDVTIADLLFVPPRFSMIPDKPADMMLLTIFVCVGLVFAAAGEFHLRYLDTEEPLSGWRQNRLEQQEALLV